VGVRVMMLNTTFNNISVIMWRTVLLVEETGIPGENHPCEEIRLEIQIKNFLQKLNLNEISLVVIVWQLDLQLHMQSVPREFEFHSDEVN
jgi:hypothetical protein